MIAHTNGADDAGAAESTRRLVLGVEVGEPFGASLAKGLVVQRAGHCVFCCRQRLAGDAPHFGGQSLETYGRGDAVVWWGESDELLLCVCL